LKNNITNDFTNMKKLNSVKNVGCYFHVGAATVHGNGEISVLRIICPKQNPSSGCEHNQFP